MKPRSLWIWLSIAALLGVLVVLHLWFGRTPPNVAQKVLPQLRPDQVTTVRIRPRGHVEIRAVKANGSWNLVEPIAYPAQSVVIETLLSELQRLEPAVFISGSDLRRAADTDDGFGLKSPTASILIDQGSYRVQLLVGARTPPGDQFYLQVVGVEGVSVVDAEILNLLPTTANHLRDTGFVDLRALAFNRLCITNGPRFFELEREATNAPWRMARPIDSRANNDRITDSLQKLGSLRVRHFVSDTPEPDLDSFGLRAPNLEISLQQGSNTVLHLKFGADATNGPGQVYANRAGSPSIVAVDRDALTPWRGSVNDFRDPHLVSLNTDVLAATITAGQTTFSVEPQTNGTWRVLPDGFAADVLLLRDFMLALAETRIVEFSKDVVTAMDLPSYGLAQPSRKYILHGPPAAPGQTNTVLVELDFGTNVNDRVFARRSDEGSVYAISLADFQQLPSSPVHLRDRQIFNINVDDLAGLTIRQQGKTRQLLRKSSHDWALAPGSQGVINELAIEESVKPLCSLAAAAWVARGADNRTSYGFSDQGYRLTLDLKDGRKFDLEIGAPIAPDSAFAAVTLDGELWIFKMQPAVLRFLGTYLTIPGTTF